MGERRRGIQGFEVAAAAALVGAVILNVETHNTQTEPSVRAISIEAADTTLDQPHRMAALAIAQSLLHARAVEACNALPSEAENRAVASATDFENLQDFLNHRKAALRTGNDYVFDSQNALTNKILVACLRESNTPQDRETLRGIARIGLGVG